MNKNYIKLFLATALVGLTVSCDKPAEVAPDPEQNQEKVSSSTEESPFTLSAEQITPIDFLLDVKAGDYDSQYYVYLSTKQDLDENFGGDVDSLVNEQLRLLIGDQLQVTDFSKVDNSVIFKGDNKIQASARWKYKLDPSLDVAVFVFGVNDYGELTTKPSMLNVKLLDAGVIADATIAVSATKINPTSVEVSMKPEAGVENYFVFAVPAGDVADGGYYTNKAEANNSNRYNEAAIDYLVNVRYFNTIDFSDVDQVDLFSGDQSTVVSQSIGNNAIVPNKSYCVIAVGVNAYGYIVSNAGHADVSTPSQSVSKLTFEVKFNEYAFAEDGFAFKIYPSDKSAKYYYNVIEKSVIDALGGGASNVDGILGLFSEYGLQDNLTYGDSSDYLRYSGLSINTDYYVVLFGYNGGITSDITLVECKTGIVL